MIRKLQSNGVAVVFISHRLDELYAVCERITVMRDGSTVAERGIHELDKLALVQLMLGREFQALQKTSVHNASPHERRPRECSASSHLRSGLRVQDASLDVRRGEIVGSRGHARLGPHRTRALRVRRPIGPTRANCASAPSASAIRQSGRRRSRAASPI